MILQLNHCTSTTNYLYGTACVNFGMWGREPDVIKRAKFQLDRFRVSEPQVAENRYLPLTRGINLTTVYALTFYTVTNVFITIKPLISLSVCF